MKTGTQQRQWEAVKSVIEEINEYWDKNKQPCEIL
jgi:hypothetical protein